MRHASLRLSVLVGAVLLWPALAAAPVAPQIFDLNRVTGAPISSSPSPGVPINGLSFFTAFDLAHGIEPWVSDGTAAGTHLLLDVWAGPANGNVAPLAALGNRLFFRANDGVAGAELWLTDGTTAGTTLLKDVNPGQADGLLDTTATVAGSALFFLGSTAAEGQELWVTDGTIGGTHLVADVRAGSAGGAFGPLVAFGSTVYFVGNDGTTGQELWRSDGTAAGTVMVADLNPGSADGVVAGSLIFGAGSWVLFAGNDGTHGLEAFATTGTLATTTLLIDANVGVNDGTPRVPVVLGSVVLFEAYDGASFGLYASDGSVAGTTSLNVAVGNASAPTLAKNQVIFNGSDATHGSEPWVTDGTVAGTALLVDLVPGTVGSNPSAFVTTGTQAWFTATDAAGLSLFVTDGTTANTLALAEGVSPASLLPSGAGLYFRASDTSSGAELWHSDGTLGGTALVADIAPGTGAGFGQFMAQLGNKVLFSANDSTHGLEPWVTDGTTAGTGSLGDLEPALTDGSSNPDVPLVVGPLAFFTANDGLHGLQVFRTDGTPAGTFSPTIGHVTNVLTPARPFNGCPTARSPTLRGYSGGVAFIAENHGINDLWVSDGTPAGTFSPTEDRGLTIDAESLLAAINGVIYFSAGSTGLGRELWATDGTVGGTALVANLSAGASSSNPHFAAVLGDQLVFLANSIIPPATTPSLNVFVSDGSQPGTVLIDNLPFPASAVPGPPLVSGGRAFWPLQVVGGTTTVRLVSTDGETLSTVSPTVQGTELVAFAGGVLFSGPSSTQRVALAKQPLFFNGLTVINLNGQIGRTGGASAPRNFTVAGSLTYFLADESTGRDILYVTDGTPGAGTHRFSSPSLKDVILFGELNGELLMNEGPWLSITVGPGRIARLARVSVPPALPFQPPLAFAFNHVYFAGNGQVWQTNGTPAGTFGVTSTTPAPTNLTIFGSQLLFSAADPNRGREEFAMPLDPTPPEITPVITGTKADAGLFISDVTLSWAIVENESQVSSQTGCAQVIISADTPGSVFTCTATSLGGTSTRAVTIKRDTQKPVLVCPAPVHAEATSDAGAAVTYALPAVQDAIDPSPTLTEDQLPGSTFALGTNTVTAVATDAAGNQQRCAFAVIVEDTTAPVLTCPGAMSLAATGPGGAPVSFTATATDAVDAAPVITAVPASGSTLPIGPTLVHVAATDAHGNAANCSFLVNVRDPGAPDLTCPPDQTVDASTATGAQVTYPAPTAHDVADPAPVVTENHHSGDTFTIGTTTVEVTATNAEGHSSSCTFAVTVRDPNAPKLSCPADQTATASTLAGIEVAYPEPTVQDPSDPMPVVVENHASGDTFPVGTTTVQVTATNRTGRSASCHFTVKVEADLKKTQCGCNSSAGLQVWPAMLLLGWLAVRRRSQKYS